MIDKLKKFEETLDQYNEKQRAKIMEAAHWAEELHREQKRASGEPYLIHPLMVAEFLVDFHMDYRTIIAGLLHDTIEDTTITIEELEKRFGKEVAHLVDGVTKISTLRTENSNSQEADTIRKMLFAMTEDIRVIIIKLADKLHNMNTLNYLTPEKQKRIATECLDIYAPLAERLGMSWLKAELEDLSLKYLNPEVYEQIRAALYKQDITKKSYLKKVERNLITAAVKEGYNIEINSRTKHIYSVYLKMKKRNKELSEIFDILGLRILCNTPAECYGMLGVVHSLWPPIEGRFKDYIAMPKANRYQSLHTTVMCYDGQLIEIQIRTHEMHSKAEYGVAAHWAYKKGLHYSHIKPEDLAIINKLKKWSADHYNSEHFLEEIKQELLKDSIYVFTPKGQIIELPKGATPIDFAFSIHTEVGYHCFGAKVDGTIVPLNYELMNTQMIEVMTTPKAHPHINWLRSVKTSKARAKIRHYLTKNDESLIIKSSIIARKKNIVKEQERQKDKPEPIENKNVINEFAPPKPGNVIRQFFDKARMSIRVGEENNIMINLAHCCSPVPGDPIIGYISRGRGIIVHRKDCSNFEHIPEIDQRTIDVEWAAKTPTQTFQFNVVSRMTSDLFSEIEGAIKKYDGHLIQGKLTENEIGSLIGIFTMEVKHTEDFKKIKKSIQSVPSVIEVFSTLAGKEQE